MTNFLRDNCDQIKTIVVKTKGTPAQKLLAILMLAGIESSTELAEMIGVLPRSIRKAKAELRDLGPTVPPARSYSSAIGPVVPPSASRVEETNLPSNLVSTVEIKESKILLRSDEPKPKKQIHGTRLDLDWTLSADLRQWTRTTFPQTTPDRLAAELETFRDYWASVAGQKGRKADWDATWRNWSRRAFATAPMRPNAQPPPNAAIARAATMRAYLNIGGTP
jgi:hypothetical protein